MSAVLVLVLVLGLRGTGLSPDLWLLSFEIPMKRQREWSRVLHVK